MQCQRCKSDRILGVNAKCSDCFNCTFQNRVMQGYVPMGLSISGGDYIEFNLCLDCGQLQDSFPIPDLRVNKVFPPEQEDEC